MPSEDMPSIHLATGVYDPDTREIHGREARVRLSPTEGRLLERLAAAQGRVVGYRDLLTDVWGYSPRAHSRTVYTTVQRLRARIEHDASAPTQLLAVAGVGYRLVLEGTPQPAAPSPSAFRPSIPAELTPMVGRERDLEAVRAALAQASVVTVVGPGGVGKTRLVTRVCHGLAASFDGGAWFCDLSAARDRDGVLAGLSRGLGVSVHGATGVGLGAALASRGRVLVVLDNIEQVVAVAAEIVQEARAAAPGAVFLGTSREPLRLAGERVLSLGPLDVPAIDATPTEIAGSSAACLFVARLREVRPGYVPDDAQWGAIAVLVRALDGLPLAIELASARGRLVSPEQMVTLLDRRLDLLAHGRRDQPGRHVSLRATIDASWELLAPVERSGLAQLSVFRGGLDLDAALAVLNLGKDPQAPWAFDLLQVLVDRSLVRVTEPDTPEAEHRYGLLESIRAYAAEQLAALGPGVVAAVEARHAAAYARYGEADALRAVDRDGAARRRLERERDNLVVALQRSIAADTPRLATQLALAVTKLLSLTGPWTLAVTLLEDTLGLGSLHDAERARLTVELGHLLTLSGRAEAAAERLDAAAALAHATRAHGVLAMALHGLASVRSGASATGLDDEALRVAQAAGLDHERATILGNVALKRARAGRTDEAITMYREALAIHRRDGNLRYVGVVLGNLAESIADKHGPARALPDFEEALAAHRALGNRRSEAITLNNYGRALERLGRVAQARDALREAWRANVEVGNLRSAALSRANLALNLRDSGRLGEAATELTAAIAELDRSGTARGADLAGAFRTELSLVHVYAGRGADARRCFEDCEAASDAEALPGYPAARRAYEGLLLLDEGDPVGACAVLDVARGLDHSSTPFVRSLWALAAARVGRAREAEEALTAGPPGDTGPLGAELLAGWAAVEAWRAMGDAERAAEREARFMALTDGERADHPLRQRLVRRDRSP